MLSGITWFACPLYSVLAKGTNLFYSSKLMVSLCNISQCLNSFLFFIFIFKISSISIYASYYDILIILLAVVAQFARRSISKWSNHLAMRCSICG